MQRPVLQKELFKTPAEKFELLPYCEKPLNVQSQLLAFFQSENLTLDLNIFYLSKKFSHSGIRNFLINKLYQRNNDELTFYIPELCYLVIKRESPELERFLLEKCSKSMQLFLQIYWSISSYGEANAADPIKYDKVKKILKFCELSMINRERIDENTNQRAISRIDLKDTKRFAQITLDKESRMDYNIAINKFINNLIKISLTLKSYKIEERKERLKYYINRANSVLEDNRKKITKDLNDFNQSVYYQGISLPFSNWDDSKYHSNMMVKILNHDFTCFNTKKRVPYKIVIETVDPEDFKFHSPNYKIEQEDLQFFSKKSNNDWEIIDEFYDPTLNTSAKPTDRALTKLNKYQGIEEYMKKVAEDEAKKLLDANNQKKNWLIPTIALKLPKFLNLTGKKEGDESSQLLENKSIIERNTEFQRNERRNMTLNTSRRKPNARAMEMQIKFTRMDSRMDSNARNTKVFNKKFPKRLLQRRGSLDFNRLNKENEESPMLKNRRKLSFKNIEVKDKLEFLQRLKPKNEEDPSKSQGFKLVVMKIEEKIRQDMESEQKNKEKDQEKTEEEIHIRKLGPWDEIWEDKAELIKIKSPYGHFPSYKLRCLIVKGGDDLRQEILAMQLIIKFKQIFENANIKCYLRPYEIIVTSANSGILEFIPNTIAIDGLKKKYPNTSLLQFYKMTYNFAFEEAQKNFVESLAAYSLVSYFLQIKDRHNGNILIDAKGYILHIDFGFMLAFSPGGINFESAPFKFTAEYLELMGGRDSNMFDYYKCLVAEGFKELRKHVDELSYIFEIMMEGSDLPCFTQFKLDVFKERFKEGLSDEECENHAEKLIDSSIDNWWTIQYDNFQKMTNGINP